MPTNLATSTKTCRILYYGPANCGKRENLAQIQASLPSEHRLALATGDPSREMAFHLKNGNQGDWQVFVTSLDAGSESPVATGTPPPFDGIVFVCDSRVDNLDDSLSAMENLKAYLDCWRLDIMSMPMVLQYNRRDGDGVLPVDRLESLINPWGLLAFPSAASSGEGVRETLKAVLSLTISQLLQREPDPSKTGGDTLAVDPNPPLPGTTHTLDPVTVETPAAATPCASRVTTDNAAAPASQAAIVIPIQVPRSSLGPDGKGRFILEVQVVDG